MIFKALICGEDDNIERWFYYDNVESAEVYYNKEICENCVQITLKTSGEHICFGINREAHLCDDNGKIIETVRSCNT